MTTYTGITNAQVDVDSPVTQTLMTLLRDNPISVFEGDSTAPRIAEKWDIQVETVLGTALDFINLDGWPAYIFHIRAGSSTGGSNFNMALSDDNGSTFAAGTNINSLASLTSYTLIMHLVRTTGVYSGYIYAGGQASSISGTLAGGSSSVDAVRFQAPNGYVSVYLRGIGEDSTV